MESKRFTLSREDLNKWGRNIVIFFGPLGLIYLAFAVANIEGDGFQWADFVPNMIVLGAMTLYLINATTDLIRKFLAGK